MVFGGTEQELRPFRLLDVPPELRNRIYRFMVVRNEIQLTYLSFDAPSEDLQPTISMVVNVYGEPDSHPMLHVCRVSQQLYNEIQPLFYAETTLYFDAGDPTFDENSVSLAMLFLSSRLRSLSMIQNLGVYLDEDIDDHGQTTLFELPPSDFLAFCDLISSRCSLRTLRISVRSICIHAYPERFDVSITKLGSPDLTRSIPDWVKQLAIVKDLKMLYVYFMYSGSSFAHRAVAIAKFMRTTMTQGGNRLQGMEGIKLQLYHGFRDEALISERMLACSMGIEKGQSCLRRERLTKVLPHGWCKSCGNFLKRHGCDCSPDVGTSNCFFGNSAQFEHIVRIRDEYWGSAELDDSTATPAVQVGDPDDLDHLYGCNVWDIRRWGGGAVKHFLPDGVTEDDFRYAVSMVKAGFSLSLPDHHGCVGRPESEFGDTDDVLSIHWDDELGCVKTGVPSRAYGVELQPQGGR